MRRPGQRTALLAGACLVALAAATCGNTQSGQAGRNGRAAKGTILRGKAAWYGGKHHGGPTASGERFDKHALTAAHRKLPFGTRVRVTNLRNKRSVEVRINDRGPFGKRERIIDVSEAAARRLGMLRAGVVPVTVEILSRPPPRTRRTRAR